MRWSKTSILFVQSFILCSLLYIDQELKLIIIILLACWIIWWCFWRWPTHQWSWWYIDYVQQRSLQHWNFGWLYSLISLKKFSRVFENPDKDTIIRRQLIFFSVLWSSASLRKQHWDQKWFIITSEKWLSSSNSISLCPRSLFNFKKLWLQEVGLRKSWNLPQYYLFFIKNCVYCFFNLKFCYSFWRLESPSTKRKWRFCFWNWN